jgi:hypothetical protein
VADELIEFVTVGDDVKTADLSKFELFGIHTGAVDLLPGAGTLGLLSGLDGTCKVFELDEGAGETRIVGDVVEEDLGCSVETIVEYAVTNELDLSAVGRGDEDLQFVELVQFGEAVNQFSLNTRLLGIAEVASRHLEETDEGLKMTLILSRCDDVLEKLVIVGLEEGFDGSNDVACSKLSLTKLAPDTRILGVLSEAESAFKGTIRVQVIDEDADGVIKDLELFINGESLFKELGLGGDGSNVGSVVVIETLDIFHDERVIGLDGGQQEQILERTVVGEARVLQDDLLEEIDELVGELGIHECTDGNCNVVRII